MTVTVKGYRARPFSRTTRGRTSSSSASRHETADTALDVAIGAAGAAGLLLLITGYLWLQVRRMRRAQKVVIGSKSADIVEYAMELLARVEHAESTAGAAESAVRALSDRVDGCFERRALLRYDALEGAARSSRSRSR